MKLIQSTAIRLITAVMTLAIIAVASALPSIAEDHGDASLASLTLFVKDRLPSDLANPRRPDALDPGSATLLDRAYETCGPAATFRNVVQAAAAATKTPVKAPVDDPTAKARWISIASMAMSEERAHAIVDAFGPDIAAGAIGALCTITHNHMLVVAQGHFESIFRLQRQNNEERTSQLDPQVIALWPLVRKNDSRIASVYPSDHSNLTAANYAGAALAQALADPLKARRDGLEVRRFYEPGEIDHDRTVYASMLHAAAAADPMFKALLFSEEAAHQKGRLELQSFIISMNWLTLPATYQETLGLAEAP